MAAPFPFFVFTLFFLFFLYVLERDTRWGGELYMEWWDEIKRLYMIL